MLRRLVEGGGLVGAAGLGGLVVGAGEALYRGAEIVYAALLYGALWSVAGLVMAAALALAGRVVAARWGFVTAVAASALILGRFVALRDFLEERNPGLATFAGLLAAAVVGAAAFGLTRYLSRRLDTAWLTSAWAYALPLGIVVAFVTQSVRGDDPLPQPPPPKPLSGSGVILYVVDALRADALGAYGAAAHRGKPASPRFDLLARGGRLFLDASAQASWTRPAVASLLSSRHVAGHATMGKAAVLPASLPTLASVLHDAGVPTAAVVTNYNLDGEFGFARGFDVYDYLAPARYLGAPPGATRLAAYNTFRLLRERFFTGRREARHFYRSAHTVNAQAFALLDVMGSGRFFIYLHVMEAHDPYFAADGRSFARVSDPKPPRDWAEPMHAAYRDGVQRADAALGELLDGLAARGVLSRTTVIVTADHGEEFAEHGGFYHGTTLYEEQLHVPLAMVGPGVSAGIEHALARQIDIAPTVLGRFQLTAPAAWEGRNLLAQGPPPTVTLAEEDHEGNKLASIRKGVRKLIRANADNPRGLSPLELYDLEADPGEQHNLAGDAAAVHKLTTALESRLRRAAAGGAKAEERELDDDDTARLRALGYVQ